MNIIPIYYLCCTGIHSAWSHPFVDCSLFSCNLALLIMTVGCKISGIWSLISFLYKRNIITINAIWRCIQYSALVLRTALQQTCRQCFMMFNIITYNQACLCLKLGGFAVNHHQSVAVVSKDTIYVKIFLIQLSQFQAHSPTHCTTLWLWNIAYMSGWEQLSSEVECVPSAVIGGPGPDIGYCQYVATLHGEYLQISAV